MPENVNTNVITIDTIIDLMRKSLGTSEKPVTINEEDVKFFNYFEIKKVINFSKKLIRILKLPEIQNDKDMESCIAFLNLNIWVDIWMTTTYQLTYERIDHDYQMKMNECRNNMYTCETILAKNESIQLKPHIDYRWKRPDINFSSYLNTQIYENVYDGETQVDGITLDTWMQNGMKTDDDKAYYNQIANVWSDIDGLTHNYDENNLSNREIRNNQVIKSMVERIHPLITPLNTASNDLIDHNIFNKEAIDLSTFDY